MHPALRSPAVPAALLAIAAAVLLTLVAAGWQPLLDADRWVADRLHSVAVAQDGWTEANRVGTDWVWDPWTMRVLTLAVVLWLLWRGQRLLALWFLGTQVVGVALQQGLKAAVGRERPHWPDPVDSAAYAAFPSGHAMTAAVTCGMLLWLLELRGATPGWRRAAWIAAGVSVAGVGFTRVWLGVHWASDVVGGWLLGAAVVAASAAAYRAMSLPAREQRDMIAK